MKTYMLHAFVLNNIMNEYYNMWRGTVSHSFLISTRKLYGSTRRPRRCRSHPLRLINVLFMLNKLFNE